LQKQFTKNIGIKHILINSEETEIENFSDNPNDRCYYCKKELFLKIKKIARENGVTFILDGSNVDDTSDYRPGMKALEELRIISPLREVGFTKQEIKELSKDMNLDTWDKPAFACLASRFPYGVKITKSKLKQIEKAELFLFSLKIKQLRVRYHEDIARIEVLQEDFQTILKNSQEITRYFKEGKIQLDEVLKKIRSLPYEDLDFVKIDTHRTLRKGYPETIFCPGKTIPQILTIIKAMSKNNHNVLLTKTDNEIFDAVKNVYPEAEYNNLGKTIVIHKEKIKPKKGNILIITAGTSDISVAEEAKVTAELMGNKVEKVYDVGVAGVHRLFDIKDKIFDAKVIIVVAGMEGALASIVGGLSASPVIAVPTSVGYGASFQGIAPLLTMMNTCAEGVVVVNIDNGFGAGYFAGLINR